MAAALSQDVNRPGIAINSYPLTTLDLARAGKGVKDARYTVFSRDYRSMAQATAHINDHRLQQGENWGPGYISGRAYQDLTRLDLEQILGREQNAGNSLSNSRGARYAKEVSL